MIWESIKTKINSSFQKGPQFLRKFKWFSERAFLNDNWLLSTIVKSIYQYFFHSPDWRTDPISTTTTVLKAGFVTAEEHSYQKQPTYLNLLETRFLTILCAILRKSQCSFTVRWYEVMGYILLCYVSEFPNDLQKQFS